MGEHGRVMLENPGPQTNITALAETIRVYDPVAYEKLVFETSQDGAGNDVVDTF